MTTRAQVTEAIFSRVKNLAGFTTKLTQLRALGNVPSADRPALFVTCSGETHGGKSANLRTRVLLYTAYIYIDSSDQSGPGGSAILDGLMDLLDAAFAPGPADDLGAGLCTLGGLVLWCVTEGNVVRVPGDLDGNGLIVLPLKVMTIPAAWGA